MFKSKHPRDIFNEIKWRFDLAKCKIYYIHRGAPRDVKIVEGSSIQNIERSFLVLQGEFEDVHIPYHRIFRIEFENQIIFEKIRKSPKDQEFKP
ncbi:MAG TPA: RNA repair domain-containing protein [Candidatus Methanoperedens sp.]